MKNFWPPRSAKVHLLRPAPTTLKSSRIVYPLMTSPAFTTTPPRPWTGRCRLLALARYFLLFVVDVLGDGFRVQVAFVPRLVLAPDLRDLLDVATLQCLQFAFGTSDCLTEFVERRDELSLQFLDARREQRLELLEVGAHTQHRHGRIVTGDSRDVFLDRPGPAVNAAGRLQVAQHQVLEVHG